jgi:hypothetical protein
MKTRIAAIMTFVMALASASTVRAGVQINDIITLANSFGHPGGSFIATDVTNPTVLPFKTYCAELEEIIFFGTPYKVVGIGTISITGGKSLTPFAAWLYDRSLGHSGGLPNFNPIDNIDNNIVQFGIWKSLGYTPGQINSSAPPINYATYDAMLTAKGWFALFNAQSAANQLAGAGNVRIMNLKFNTTNAQDQFVEVPEPFSAVIWPVILICVGGSWTLISRRG